MRIKQPRLVVGIAVAIAAMFLLAPLFNTSEISSTTARARLEFTLLAESGPTIIIDIDSRSEWIRISGPTPVGGHELFVSGDRLIVRVETDGATDGLLVQMPLSIVFPELTGLRPSVLAASLNRRLRQCSPASPVESEIARTFFLAEMNDVGDVLAVCGSAVHKNNGTSSRLSQRESELTAPINVPSAGVMLLEDMDESEAAAIPAIVQSWFE